MKFTRTSALWVLAASFGLTSLFAAVVGWPDVLAIGFLSACFQAIMIVCVLAFLAISGPLDEDEHARRHYPILTIGFWISAGAATAFGVAVWSLTNVSEQFEIMTDYFALAICLLTP